MAIFFSLSTVTYRRNFQSDLGKKGDEMIYCLRLLIDEKKKSCPAFNRDEKIPIYKR